MLNLITSYFKIYVQLAEISLPIYLSYAHIKGIIFLQFLINLNLFYPPSRYQNENDLQYYYGILNFFMYPYLIVQLNSLIVERLVFQNINILIQILLLHLAFILIIYAIQIGQLVYQQKQPMLPQFQQYILQILPLVLFQPITLMASLVLNQSPFSIFSGVIAILTLILLLILLIISQLFFVTPTQWLLRSRPFTQPYGNLFGPIIAFQFLTIFLQPFHLPPNLTGILTIFYFLFPTIQLFLQKFRNTYSDLQFTLYSTSIILAIIYTVNELKRQTENYLLSEFYEFWILGLLCFAVMKEVRVILHSDCCTYQQIGQMLECDKEQLTLSEQKEHKFSFIQTKIFHDKYLVTPFCPFKRKDVQETWFYNEKSSLAHFLNSLFTKNENLNSVQFTLSAIIFIYRHLKYPLQALFLIYRFQQANQNISPYPSLVLSIVEEQIKYNCRVDQCSQLKQKVASGDIFFQLNVFQFYKSMTIFHEYLRLQRPLVQLKINFWQKLINGYNSLDELKQDTISITGKIDSIEKLMEQNFNVQQQTYKEQLRSGSEDYCFQKDDILVLKMFSWYFTFILNDFRKTFRVEGKINELLNRDRVSTHKLNNISIYHKKSLLLMMNGFTNKGLLINKNQEEIANFFQFDDKDYHIYRQINYLMPDFISDRHNDIIENFICKGFSKLFYSQQKTFALTQKGFIIPVSLQLGNSIENNQDFLLTAAFLRIKHASDFVIFDQKGAIKEVTQNFFKQCILPYQTNRQFDILQFKKLSYVQFFFGIQINRVIEQLKQAEHNEYYLSEDRIIFQCPQKLEALQIEFENYLKKLALLKGNRTSKFSKTNTKFNTFRTQEGYKFDDEDKMKEIDDTTLMIKGSHIEMLSEEYQDTIEQFLGDPQQFINYENTDAKQLIYSLTFNQIGLDKFAYFIMEIKEIKTKKNVADKKSLSKFQTHVADKSVSQNSVINEDGSNLNIKATPHSVSNYSSNSAKKMIKAELKFTNQMLEANGKQDDFSQSYGASDIQIALSANQNEKAVGSLEQPPSKKINFIYPASSQRNYMEDESDNAMENEIKELKLKYTKQGKGQFFSNRMSINQNIDFDQDLEAENQIDLKKFRSYTSQKKNLHFEGVIEHEEISREDQNSLKSGSSNSSYFLNLLYTKAHNKVINRALLKVIAMNFVIFILVFSFFFINNSVIQDHLQVQKEQLINLRNHIIFNQQYQTICSLTQIQLIQQYSKGQIKYSNYVNEFIHKEMNEVHDKFLENYQELFKILRIVDDFHSGMQINMFIINDLHIQVQQVYSTQYLQILAEYWQQIIDYSEKDEDLLSTVNALSAILFFRINLSSQNNLLGDIIEVGMALNDAMEADLTYEITYRIGIEISLLVFLVLAQYFFFKENKKQEEQLMLTMAAYHQIEAENAIFQQEFIFLITFSYKYFQNQLQELSNVYKIESSKVIYKKQKNRFNGQNYNKVTSNLASRIKSMSFSMMKSFLILILNLILIILYYVGSYLIFASEDNTVSYLLSLTFSGIELQHHTDDLITIGETLKLDPFLIDEFYINLVAEENLLKNATNQIMSQLTFNFNEFVIQQQDFTKQFLLLEYGEQNHRDHLYSILKNDLCIESPEFFIACGTNKTKFNVDLPPQPEEDNNKNFISKGLEGVQIQIGQLFTMYFHGELTFQKYESNKTELIRFLNSDIQKKQFLSYTLEVKDLVDSFINEIYEMTLDGINQVMFHQTLYIFIGGFAFLFLLLFSLFSGLSRIHNEYHLLKKGFILIPFQALLSQNLSKSINTKLD